MVRRYKIFKSQRGRSLDVYEILCFSPLGTLAMSLLSKIKRILKKKRASVSCSVKIPIRVLVPSQHNKNRV